MVYMPCIISPFYLAGACASNIIFSGKSIVNFFISHEITARVTKDVMIKMKIGQIIPCTDTCNYLGITMCSHDENVIIDKAITDMNMRLNNLLLLLY